MAYKANLERLMISKRQDTLFDRWSQITLKDVLEITAHKIEIYGEDAFLELTTEPYDDTIRAYIFKMVPESDEEMETRVAKELVWEKQHKERQEWLLNYQKCFGNDKLIDLMAGYFVFTSELYKKVRSDYPLSPLVVMQNLEEK